MKHTKLLTFAIAALFAGTSMAADYIPTSVYKVGTESTLGTKWTDKGQPQNYFVSGDTTIFSAFVCYQSCGAGKQEWTGKKGDVGSTNGTYSATQYFKGSAAWGTGDAGTKVTTFRSDRIAIYNVTNCASVHVLADLAGKSREMYINAYEIVNGVVSTTVSASATHTENGIGITTLSGLDGNKTYQIQLLTNNASNSKLYEIAFVAAPMAKNIATLSSISVDGEPLADFAPDKLTYTVELSYGTITVPTVTVTCTSKKATPVITPATAVPGATTITVTSEDGKETETYTVNFTVAAAASSEKELLNVKIGGQAVAIENNAGSLLVSKNADLTQQTITFEVSESATASITSGSTQDFTNPLTITVTAQDKSTATYTITLTKAAKDVLYLTTASVEGDKLYKAVAATGYYVEVRANNTNTVFSAYDLVVLHESLKGADAASGELSALATADVPVLNTKAYFYNEGRWGWGTPDNGNSQQGVKLNTAKYSNIASHPLFAGFTGDSITLYTAEGAKNIQPIKSFTAGKEGYALANVPGGVAIHELPAADRVGESGTAKYLLISLSNAAWSNLSDDASKLFSNAINYLLGTEAWAPQVVPSAIDAVSADTQAVKRIINGQLVIEKNGQRYNAQGIVIE